MISVVLSYPGQEFFYIIAYNAGILSFLLVEAHIDWCFRPAQRLGEIGFTFFLGAGIPISVIGCLIDFDRNAFMRVLGWMVEFITAIIFAKVVTDKLEWPLLTRAKGIENKLR